MRVNPRFETLAPRSLMRVSVRVARTAFFVPMTDLDTSTPLGRAFAARSSGFLQDEVEGLDRRDFLYGGAVAVVFLIVPIVVHPDHDQYHRLRLGGSRPGHSAVEFA